MLLYIDKNTYKILKHNSILDCKTHVVNTKYLLLKQYNSQEKQQTSINAPKSYLNKLKRDTRKEKITLYTSQHNNSILKI